MYGSIITGDNLCCGTDVINKTENEQQEYYDDILYGIFFLAAIFPVQKNAYFLAAVFFLMGCTDAVIHNIISACLQLNTDAEFRGVVFSLYSLTNNVMKPISISIGGILGEYFDIGKLIMVIMIAGIIALGFCFRNKALLDFMTLYKKGMER